MYSYNDVANFNKYFQFEVNLKEPTDIDDVTLYLHGYNKAAIKDNKIMISADGNILSSTRPDRELDLQNYIAKKNHYVFPLIGAVA